MIVLCNSCFKNYTLQPIFSSVPIVNNLCLISVKEKLVNS